MVQKKYEMMYALTNSICTHLGIQFSICHHIPQVASVVLQQLLAWCIVYKIPLIETGKNKKRENRANIPYTCEIYVKEYSSSQLELDKKIKAYFPYPCA